MKIMQKQRQVKLDIVMTLEVINYMHGGLMNMLDNQDRMMQKIVHHQFKQVLVLIGLNNAFLQELLQIDLIVMLLKLMDHYMDGEKMEMDNQHKIMKYHIIPHQFKYLVLHGLLKGVNLVLVVMVILLQSKQMDHYGYGELIIMENQDKINQVILDGVHHQFKYLVLTVGVV